MRTRCVDVLANVTLSCTAASSGGEQLPSGDGSHYAAGFGIMSARLKEAEELIGEAPPFSCVARIIIVTFLLVSKMARILLKRDDDRIRRCT